ncbi:MAG: hypothetical protein HYS33_04790, partial [Acidobacteria bacterium]|nr:hypothetical protein [Acidobacteriota bacterium]
GSRLPALIDRRVSTQLSLTSGHTFGLGGMISQVKQEWLDRIPVLDPIDAVPKYTKSGEARRKAGPHRLKV